MQSDGGSRRLATSNWLSSKGGQMYSHSLSAGRHLRRARLARAVLIVAAAVVVLAVPAPTLAAEPMVVPPTGPSYNDLAVAWWQYALRQPAATNPVLHTTGAA